MAPLVYAELTASPLRAVCGCRGLPATASGFAISSYMCLRSKKAACLTLRSVGCPGAELNRMAGVLRIMGCAT